MEADLLTKGVIITIVSILFVIYILTITKKDKGKSNGNNTTQQNANPNDTANKLQNNMTISKIYFSPEGRISRKQFWFAILSVFILSTISQLLLESQDDAIAGIGGLFAISIIWPTLAVQIKRWHDRGKSGWWILINMIPYIGPLWSLIELGFLKGEDGANIYGQPANTVTDNTNRTSTKVEEDDETVFSEKQAKLSDDHKDLIAMIAIFAKSDGVITKKEIKIIDDFFCTVLNFDNRIRKKAIAHFNKSKNSSLPYKIYLKRFYNENRYNIYPYPLSIPISPLFKVEVAAVSSFALRGEGVA